jgi:hypothetical protein
MRQRRNDGSRKGTTIRFWLGWRFYVSTHLLELFRPTKGRKIMATYHGITKAICLNCGKVTTDETQLEILNDLDPTCAVCDVHAVAWHTSKGVVVTAQKTTEEDSETERFAILEKENN